MPAGKSVSFLSYVGSSGPNCRRCRPQRGKALRWTMVLTLVQPAGHDHEDDALSYCVRPYEPEQRQCKLVLERRHKEEVAHRQRGEAGQGKEPAAMPVLTEADVLPQPEHARPEHPNPDQAGQCYPPEGKERERHQARPNAHQPLTDEEPLERRPSRASARRRQREGSIHKRVGSEQCNQVDHRYDREEQGPDSEKQGSQPPKTGRGPAVQDVWHPYPLSIDAPAT